MADSSADSTRDPVARERPGMPRWVKVIGIAALVVVLLVVVLVLTGAGGEHGPGRHAAWSDAGARTLFVSALG